LLAQVDEKIESALQEAKDSGRFDGPPGDDYVLTAADKAEIAKQVAGLSSKEKGLMLTLFKNMLSQKDMSDTVNELEKTWATGGNDNTGGGSGETPDVPDEPDVPVEPDVPDTPETYSITYHLTNVTAANIITSMIGGNSFSTTLEADENYKLGDVTVTMGGIEVTDSVYADGVITISSVTGNIVINAVGVEMGDATAWEDGIPYSFTIIENEYVNPADGTFKPEAGTLRTDFTPCLGVDVLYFSKAETFNRKYNAFFDENKNFVSGLTVFNNHYVEIPSNVAYFVISYFPLVTSGECTVTPLAKTEGTWEDGVPYELAPFAQDYWYSTGTGELKYEAGCNWKATEKLNCANASKLVLSAPTGYGAFYDKLGNIVVGGWKESTEVPVPRFATHFAVSKSNAFMDSLVVTPYA
jgi:hypothetical protein